MVEQDAAGKYLIFWRAKCLTTNRELTFRSAAGFWPATFEIWRDEYVNKFHRHLELLEYRPWNSNEDEHRILYPVPIQNVIFQVIKPNLARPDPRRTSLLISRPKGAGLLGGQSLLKGA